VRLIELKIRLQIGLQESLYAVCETNTINRLESAIHRKSLMAVQITLYDSIGRVAEPRKR
jgi:hypothetical protein